MLFQKDNQLLCFIHIPRNGGRFVYNLLKTNSFNITPRSILFQKKKFYSEQEYLHLTYNKIAEIHPEALYAKKIVIIRDPIEKFKSAIGTEWAQSLYLKEDMLSKMDDSEYFKYVMEKKRFGLRTKGIDFKFNGLKNTFTNWFRPQSEFYNEDFRVWKFENGFGMDFRIFLRDTVGLDIDINIEIERNYSKLSYDDKIEGFSLSKKLTENVLNFYWADHQIWKQL